MNRFRPTEKHASRWLASMLLLLVCAWDSGTAVAGITAVSLTEASPESQQLDGAKLNAALAKIDDGDYGDIDALLVVRNNRLVLERYFSPQYHGREYMRPLLSTTKSIASALIGIAIGQDKITDVETNLLGYFAEYPEIRNQDARKQKITLENVLTMSAGFRWNELAISYADPRNDFNRMEQSRDWIKYVLDAPMSHAPGDQMVYSSGCTLLLSGILQKSTGQSAEAFAIDHLFGPLGIENYTWSQARGDMTNTYTGLAMRRRDLAKIGMLFLNQGRWLGSQLIPQQWVRQSTRAHITAGPDTAGNLYDYGYQWWRFHARDPTVKDLKINDVYFSWGYGGQFIFVVPHLELVVVSTGNIYGADHRRAFDLLRDYVFPAVLDQ